MNVDAFLEQAEEYEAGGDLRDSVLKILNVLPRSHPFTTVRAAELKKWAASRDYQRLMDGHYPRREEDKDTSVSDSFRESAASYAETVRTSKDPLMKLVGDMAGGTADLGGKLYGKFTGAGSASRTSDRPANGGPANGAKGGPQDRPSGPAADGDGPQDEPGRDA